MTHQIKMLVTSSSHVMIASMLVLQLVLNADGALVEPSFTIKLETLHSNAVASKLENQNISLAQLSSELLIAVDFPATGLPISVMLLKTANSQPWNLATRLAQMYLFTKSAMLLKRNAKLAKWVIQAAILPLSAKQPVTNLMPNVMKLQAHVDLATQLQIRIVQTRQEVAEKSARSRPYQSVITILESAIHVLMDKDALTLLHVILLARKSHQYQRMILTPATGPLNHQNAS